MTTYTPEELLQKAKDYLYETPPDQSQSAEKVYF